MSKQNEVRGVLSQMVAGAARKHLNPGKYWGLKDCWKGEKRYCEGDNDSASSLVSFVENRVLKIWFPFFREMGGHEMWKTTSECGKKKIISLNHTIMM